MKPWKPGDPVHELSSEELAGIREFAKRTLGRAVLLPGDEVWNEALKEATAELVKRGAIKNESEEW